MPQENNERVAQALMTVPEKQLLIFSLVWEVVGSDGLDYDKVSDRQREINLAVAEGHAYARATERAITALRDLPAVSGGRDV